MKEGQILREAENKEVIVIMQRNFDKKMQELVFTTSKCETRSDEKIIQKTNQCLLRDNFQVMARAGIKKN